MKHCLIVDDCRFIRTVARGMFESIDFRTSEACDAEEALAFCREKSTDVILLDWNMPGMSGIDLLYKLREVWAAMSERPYIFICTTQGSVADVHEAVSAGADDFVHKPFDQDLLASKLQLVGLH